MASRDAGKPVPRELLVTVVASTCAGVEAGDSAGTDAATAAGHAPTFWAGMLLTILTAMTGAVGRRSALPGLARADCWPGSR